MRGCLVGMTLCFAICSAQVALAQVQPVQPGGEQRSVAIDQLLGRGGRQKHALRVNTLMVGGKSHNWAAYAAWGRELFLQGQVAKPPIGEAPSKPLSDFYRCTHCHNIAREDATLTLQDPEVRVAWIEAAAHKPAGDHPLMLAPGTTLWGAVNRESFYNDSFEIYHFLKNAADKEMDPKSLDDAIQICCRYCSVGRFAEPWELTSLLAYLWDHELVLADLQLPAPVEAAVVATLCDPAAAASEAGKSMRAFLRRHYLVRAGDTYTAEPQKAALGETGPYGDKAQFKGDPAVGKRLYALACDQCHGKEKPNEIAGSTLVRDLRKFHNVLAHGTARDDQPYMPMFTAQRISRQQIADIQAYLQALGQGKAP